MIKKRLSKDGYKLHEFTDGTMCAEKDGDRYYEKNYNKLYLQIYGKDNRE